MFLEKSAYKNRVCFLFIAFTLALAENASLLAQGLELKPSEIRGSTGRKPVSVLQQRYFQKSLRPEIGLVGGQFLNEAYTVTYYSGGRLGLFFNEWIGFEVEYLETSVKDSDDRKALNTLRYRKLNTDEVVSPDPEVNKVRKIIDGSLSLAPFYGKLNFIDSLIIYTDIYILLGISNLKTEQGKINGFHWNIGERFYVYDALSVRFDFKDRIYTEMRGGQKSQKNGLGIEIGVSYFFGENQYAAQ